METADDVRLRIEAAKLEVENERLKLEHARILNEGERPYREAVMRFAEMTVRSLLILNGAAALALIAFVGNGVKGDSAALSSAIAQMRSAVLSFGAGAFLSVLTSALAYLAQVAFTEGRDRGWKPCWAEALRIFAILSALAGLGMFACGVGIVSRWK